MTRTVLAILLLLAGAGPANAWLCRNADLEVTCGPDGCQVSEGFTPMDVFLSEEGQMAVCAYSGCWEGRANQIVRSDRYLMLAANELRWTTGSGREAIAVLLDKETGIAVINGAGFAHPLQCEP